MDVGDVLGERNGVTVAEVAAKTVLNRSSPSGRVAMDLTINPYRGCEFGCRYCYARYTHQYLDLTDPDQFETRIFAKTNAPEVLAAELAHQSVAGRTIAIGTATDPYQPVERRLRITRGILEALCGCRGANLRLLTKSDLILRDLDLLMRLHERHRLAVGLTIVTVDRAVQRRLEPRAPTPQKRLAALRELAAAGLRVGISYAPMLPGVNDSADAIATVLGPVAAAGGVFAFMTPLWIQSGARPLVFRWLGNQFPGLLTAYRQWYAHGMEVPPSLRRQMIDRFRDLAAQHGLSDSALAAEETAEQLTLF